MGSDADPTSGDLPAPAPSNVSPDVVRSFRSQLTHGEDVIDPTTWAGSVPHVNGIAPRVRVGRSRWFNLLWLLPIGFLALIVAIAVAKGLRGESSVQQFIERYPGTVESSSEATTGFPAWARWEHFFNAFFLIFILRSGLQILSDHPRLYWGYSQDTPETASSAAARRRAGLHSSLRASNVEPRRRRRRRRAGGPQRAQWSTSSSSSASMASWWVGRL